MAYSVDLRKRVVEQVKVGNQTQEEVATLYQVSLSSLKRWLNLEDLTPGKPGPRCPRMDIQALQQVVKEKPDAYLDEYATMLNTSSSSVSRNLIKLGIHRKKNDAILRTERR